MTNQPTTNSTARHVKSTPKKTLPFTFDLSFHNTRITLMIILLLMMILVGIVNHQALNTMTIIVFVVAELLSLLIPEVHRKWGNYLWIL